VPTILQRISNGDQSAANDCVDEYGGLIWRLARRYLDRAESEVEDAVQDVFLELWLHADRFDPSKGSEAAFVATLAHRRIIDRQRKISTQRRHERKSANELTSSNRSIPSLAADHEGANQGPLYGKELANGFDKLPETEQTALWMSAYRGLSHRDISEITDVPIGTVKSRIRRAMIRLTKTILGESADIDCERSAL
jgi:RNA polymerase sigma-70 factor, ECF subfamily